MSAINLFWAKIFSPKPEMKIFYSQAENKIQVSFLFFQIFTHNNTKNSCVCGLLRFEKNPENI